MPEEVAHIQWLCGQIFVALLDDLLELADGQSLVYGLQKMLEYVGWECFETLVETRECLKVILDGI